MDISNLTPILVVASLAASVWLVWRVNKLYDRIDSVEWLTLILAKKDMDRDNQSDQ
jgi:predicted membrane chloride channel (bestrophin family)